MKTSILYSWILCFSFFVVSCGEQASDDSSSAQSTSESSHPNVDRNADKNAYFGDLHVHTSWSFDAFIYNVRTDPDDAYAFAKGEPIDHFVLDKIKIERPLD